jgi:hypothetical protein
VVAAIVLVPLGIFIWHQKIKLKKKRKIFGQCLLLVFVTIYFNFTESYAVELRQYTADTEVVKIPEAPIGSQLQLKKVDVEERVFDINRVSEDSSLKEFVENYMGETYERGCALYEFLEKENISADKELIFMCTVCLCGPQLGNIIVII